jgi:hypothetical protein
LDVPFPAATQWEMVEEEQRELSPFNDRNNTAG